MENFQDGGLVADFRLSALIESVGFVCQSLYFGRKVLLMINLDLLRVLWFIAVNFCLSSAMNSCQVNTQFFYTLTSNTEI